MYKYKDNSKKFMKIKDELNWAQNIVEIHA